LHDLVATQKPKIPNRRWTTGALLALMIVVNYLDRGNLSIAMPAIRRDLSLTNLQVGMVLAGFQWTYAIANVPMGWVADRYGPRRVVLAAGIAWTICAAATGLAAGLGALILMRACLGLAESPMFPAGIKIVNSWFPNREKALAIGMYEVAVQLGSAGAPLLGAYLVLAVGWRLMFVVMAALSLVPLVIWWFRYREPEADAGLSPQELRLILADRQDARIAPPSFAQWGGLFGHMQTWAMILGGMSLAGMLSFYLWLPIYLQQTRHFSLVHAGGSMSVLGLVGIAGVISGALSSDLLIRRGWQVLAARRAVVVSGALIGGAAIGCTALSHRDIVLLVMIAVGSFAGGLNAAPWWSLAPAVAPSDRLVASLGSLQNGGAFLGAAIAPLAIGALLDHGDDFHTILAVSAGFALLTAFIYGVVLQRPIQPAVKP
jgi:MFS family permease